MPGITLSISCFYFSSSIQIRNVSNPSSVLLNSSGFLENSYPRQLNARAKCVSLPTSIPTTKVFSVIAAILVFCVLDFILDTSLVMDLLTVVGQQTLYYSEVSFLSPAFFRVPIFESYRKLLHGDYRTIF